MPKYKTDYHVIRSVGNKVEVKDNNSKMSWYYISDVKKTDMVTKLICQLPDYDAFSRKGKLSFDQEYIQDLAWTHKIKNSSLTILMFLTYLPRHNRDLTLCS